MPAVDPKKLKRLMVTELLVPFAMKRRLSGGQLADLADRAMRDKRFDLSATTDEFAAHMDEGEASDWADGFERAGSAPHLFVTAAGDEAKPEELFGGVKKSELAKLSPEARLHLANQVADEQRRNVNKH